MISLASYKGLFSSISNEYSTPQTLFDLLNNEFHFILDACATKENAKCEKYFTMDDNGLKQNWLNPTFCNPPYGNQIKFWVQKSYEESLKGNTVVCLIPSRTETKYQHEIIFKYANAICFIKGRLKFIRNKIGNPAPFPSQLVIFSTIQLTKGQTNCLESIGKLVILR